MKSAFKAELLKLRTVRSTFIISLIGLFFAGFDMFMQASHWATPLTHSMQSDLILEAIMVASTIGALVGVLLVTHEYRYNTVAYTLTATHNKRDVLFAKISAITVYSVLFTGCVIVTATLFLRLGLAAHGLTLPSQTVSFGNWLWRGMFVGWGMSMLALAMAALIRNQVAAIVALFLFPGPIEQLLSLLLKSNYEYLPFKALNDVAANSQKISHTSGAIITLFYLFVGFGLSWILLIKQDAN